MILLDSMPTIIQEHLWEIQKGATELEYHNSIFGRPHRIAPTLHKLRVKHATHPPHGEENRVGHRLTLQDSEQTEQVELAGGFEEFAVSEEGADSTAG